MDVQRIVELVKAGEAYAQSLKVGDVFNGSHGEASARGYKDQERNAFGAGALNVLGRMNVWTDAQSVITKLEQR